MVTPRKPWMLIGLISLAIIIGVSLILHFSNEKRRIRKQFKRLSDTVSFASGEGLFAHGLKSNRSGTFFAEKTTLNIPVHGLSGQYSRTDIVQNVLKAKNTCTRLSLQFYDLTIDLPEQSRASVTTTARLKGQTRAGETFNEIRELHCTLNKTDGHWLLTTCIVDTVITR